MDVTGTIAICLIVGVLIAAALACKLGAPRMPPPDPTSGFRDPAR